MINQQKCTVEDKNQLVNAVDIIELRARRIVLQTELATQLELVHKFAFIFFYWQVVVDIGEST